MARFIDLGEDDDQQDSGSLSEQRLRRGFHDVSPLNNGPPQRSAGDGPVKPVKPDIDTETPRFSNAITHAFQCYPYLTLKPQFYSAD